MYSYTDNSNTSDEKEDRYSLSNILRLRKKAARYQGDWRSDAREDYKFRDGDQWDDEDKAYLEEQGRPCVTFNRIGPIVNSIKGQELNSRQEIRYLPRNVHDNDSSIVEVLNAAISFVRDSCDAEDEESDAYEDAVTCGMGWIETLVDFNEDPDGKITEERVPPLEMRWDTSSKKRNLSDRHWHMREKWIPRGEVEEKWPKAKLDQVGFDAMADEVESEQHDATEAWKYQEDQMDRFLNDKEDQILVIQFSYKEREAYWRVGDPESGRVVEFDTKRYNRIKDKLDMLGVPKVKQHRWVYKTKYLAGREELETGMSAVQGWTINPITANREESKNVWYGIVKAMKDPQMWANKFFAQIMHIFNTNPKGGLIYEKGSIDDTYDIEAKWADSSGIIEVEEGALTGKKLQERTMSNYPASLDKMLQFAISSIRDVSGMNVEMLGMANREQSGVLEQERKKAALVILAPLQNSLRHFRKQQGRVLLMFVAEYMPNGTMIRILEKGQQQFVPFTKDFDVLKYDTIVDTSPNSPNLKQEVWGTMSQILPQMIQAGVPIPPALLDFSPLPESVVTEWKKYIEESKRPDPKVQKQMQGMQQENQKLKQQVQQLASKKEEHRASMQQDAQEFQMEMQQKREEAAMDMQIEERKMLLEQRNAEMKLALEEKTSQAKLRTEINKIQTHYDLEIRKLEEKSTTEEFVIEKKMELESRKLGIPTDEEVQKAEEEETENIDRLIAELQKPVKVKRNKKGLITSLG